MERAAGFVQWFPVIVKGGLDARLDVTKGENKVSSRASSGVRARRRSSPASGPLWVRFAGDGSHEEEEVTDKPRRKFKFDKDSETDAFGRDPRKETDFWRGAARELVETEEVKAALDDHAKKNPGGDGLTDEQRAYLEFAKSLESKEESKEEEAKED